MNSLLNRKVDLNGLGKSIGVVTVIAVAMATVSAFAGGGMPWEGPLALIQSSLSGPVAGGISLIALVVAGAALIFGEDMGGFAKKMIGVVMGASVLVLGNTLLSGLGLTASGFAFGV
jgi:type IV secretion system protein VirB2